MTSLFLSFHMLGKKLQKDTSDNTIYKMKSEYKGDVRGKLKIDERGVKLLL